MGVLSYIKLGTKESEKSEDSPLVIMIPRDYFAESSRNVEDLTIGQTLNVSIVGCRIKYLSDKIQAVAKPIE